MRPITNPLVSQVTVGCVFHGVDLHTIYSAPLVLLFVSSTDTYL
jgi:hypothetical protein